MKVSVLIITYNHEGFVAQTIQSALMQETTFDYEIVIGEDCSTDCTREICLNYQRQFPEKIQVLPRKTNLGAMRNFVDTLKNCKGEYIAICEGDDYWTDPLKLQKQVDFLENNPEFAVCHHHFLVQDEQRGLTDDPNSTSRRDYTIEEMVTGAFMLPNTLLFRNIDIEFPVESLRILNGDVFIISQLARHGAAKYLPDVGPSVYRLHNGGVWSTRDNLSRINSQILTFGVIKKYSDKKHSKILRRQLFKYQYRKYSHFRRSGQTGHLLIQAFKMFNLNPILVARLFITSRTWGVNSWVGGRLKRHSEIRKANSTS